MCRILFSVLTVAILLNSTNGARILAIIPTPAYSHQTAFRPIWKALSSRGHEVILVTTDPMNDATLENVKEIDVSFSYKLKDDEKLHEMKDDVNKFMNNIFEMQINIQDQQLSHPEVQSILKNETEYFDLLMVEYTMPVVMGLSHRFKAPVIGVFSMSGFDAMHSSIGDFVHTVACPDMMLPFVDNLSFTERLISSLVYVLINFIYLTYKPLVDKTLRKHFGEDCPPGEELMTNVDLVFTYTNPIFHKIRPTVPANVFVAGLHIKDPESLPKDLQEYMDGSKNGVVYFSLGTSVKSRDIPASTKEIIMQTFAKLPYDVLWKFEDAELEGKPDNVKIIKWAPQQDVLRHRKIKLFITQGGLQSIEEAIYSHVPMLVLPVAGDQFYNAKNVVYRGIGESLKMHEMDEDSFKDTILEVINNPKYKNRVEELGELTMDQPMTSLERAVWWTEYVIRHKGAKHLKGPAVDLPMYQYLLLDVLAFCLAVVLVIVFILVQAFKLVKKFILSRLFELIFKKKKKE